MMTTANSGQREHEASASRNLPLYEKPVLTETRVGDLLRNVDNVTNDGGIGCCACVWAS